MSWTDYLPGGGARVAARGADKAADQYTKLANDQKGYYEQGTQKAQGYWGQAQGAYDRIYGGQPSLTEQYYQQMSGKDPFAFERGQSAKALDSEYAARGGGNSGAALAAQALGQSAFDSKLMQYRGQLAGQADQSRQAQFQGQMGISQGQVGTQTAGNQMAGGAYQDAYSAGIASHQNAAALRGKGYADVTNFGFDALKAGAAAMTGNPAIAASIQGSGGGGYGGGGNPMAGGSNPLSPGQLQNPGYGQNAYSFQGQGGQPDYYQGGYGGGQGGAGYQQQQSPLSPGSLNAPRYGMTDPYGRMSY